MAITSLAPEEEEEEAPVANVAPPQQAATTADLFSCLHAILNQFEEAEGAADLELRDKLSDLFAETSKVPAPAEDIENQLSDLSERMELLEAKVAELAQDEEAESLLRETSKLWMPVITGERSNAMASSPPDESR
ncbi:uncharacterized protein LOC112347623 [Selaginella moellendorffii]|uniref:uncharacterized protein LOC112347623 n=1 Tax=Selaginella moellendorffii TaxID=88036 RepID=UPI000D1CEBF0|nr:uncharacterized protein LOC112347623 [Selaginella moellendorffii]|eukprot:XP_024534513.1 uncharacterized protein LOC112347623 [Selaginella moellendorffii]